MKVSKAHQVVIHLSQLDENGHHTYVQYLTWPFNIRVELKKGKLFKMSPAIDLNKVID